MDAHVKPEIVITKAADGLEFHNQTVPAKGPENRASGAPPSSFVHGGPQRQMMPAYHYMQFYHWALRHQISGWPNQGYIVMSINYRLGVGYGRSFRMAANAGAAGNSDIRTWLRAASTFSRDPMFDPNRVGIWGLSYGGCSRHRPWRATPISSKPVSYLCGRAPLRQFARS